MPTTDLTLRIDAINEIFSKQKSGYNLSIDNEKHFETELNYIQIKHNKNKQTLSIPVTQDMLNEDDTELAHHLASTYLLYINNFKEDEIVDEKYILKNVVPVKMKKRHKKAANMMDIIYKEKLFSIITYAVPITTLNGNKTERLPIPMTYDLLHKLNMNENQLFDIPEK